jgi:hypothetical protein
MYRHINWIRCRQKAEFKHVHCSVQTPLTHYCTHSSTHARDKWTDRLIHSFTGCWGSTRPHVHSRLRHAKGATGDGGGRTAARILGRWLSVPLRAQMSICILLFPVVFSCVGRGVCTKWHPVQTSSYLKIRGHAVAQWLRHSATNRKVAGSIPDGVIGIFRWPNPSSCTMALGST